MIDYDGRVYGVRQNTENGEVGGAPGSSTGRRATGTSELIEVMPDKAPPENAS